MERDLARKIVDSALGKDYSPEAISEVWSYLSDKSLSYISNRSKDIMEEEENGNIQGTMDDPTLDPSLEREYFHKSFEEGDSTVTIKTIGVGRNKPVSVYIDGMRWEMFTGPKTAEKETKKFLGSKQFENWKQSKMPKKEETKPAEEPSEEPAENAEDTK